MRAALLLILAVLSSLQVAQAADWPAARAGLARTGVVPSDSAPPYTLLWTRTNADAWAGDPLVAYGRVFLTDATRRVMVLDLAAGTNVWAAAEGAAPNELRDYDTATGEVRWSRTFSSSLVRAPQLGLDAGYAVMNGRICGVRQRDGAIRWSRSLGALTTPAAADAWLVIVGSGNVAEGLDAVTGGLLFSVKLKGPLAFPPVLTSQGAYLPLADELIAVDRRGKHRWRAELPKPLTAPLAVSSSGVVVACADGSVRLLRTKDGHAAWETLIAGVPSTLAGAGTVVYVGTRQGTLVGLRLTDGVSRWSAGLGQGAITGLVVAGGRLVATAGAWAGALRPAPLPPDNVALTTEDGVVRLAWNEGTANGAPITGYRVWRKRGTAWGLASSSSATQFFAEAPLPGDMSYAVTAVAEDGAESARSADAAHVAADPVLLNVVASPQPYDSRHGELVVSFGLRTAARVTWSVVDAEAVALTNDQTVFLAQGPGSIVWNGRDRNGRIVDPGACRVRLTAVADGLSDSAARVVAVAWPAGGADGAGIGGTPGGGPDTPVVAGAGSSPAAGGDAGPAPVVDPHDNGQHDGSNPNNFTIDHHDNGHHGR